MEQPQFADASGPVANPGRVRTARNFGRGNIKRTEAERAARLVYLEKIGRRCDANNRHCSRNAASRWVIYVELDPETGAELHDGQEQRAQVCASHQSDWTRHTERYRILRIEKMPPRTDPMMTRIPDKHRHA